MVKKHHAIHANFQTMFALAAAHRCSSIDAWCLMQHVNCTFGQWRQHYNAQEAVPACQPVQETA